MNRRATVWMIGIAFLVVLTAKLLRFGMMLLLFLLALLAVLLLLQRIGRR